MFCRRCGHELNEGAVICPHCGVATPNYKGQFGQYTAGTPEAGKTAEPNYVNSFNQPIQPKRVNGFGIAGFVLSLLSVYFGVYFCIASVLAFVFSLIGVTKSKEYSSCNGLAIAGLVIGSITLLFWAIVYIFAFGIIMGIFY